MEYRLLGRSGLKVSSLALGTMTFGGHGVFALAGDTGVDGARRQIDMALDAGINLIDTADIYSAGISEEIVGEVLKGRRERVLLATKARFPTGSGPNDRGLSRHHLMQACDASLKRLRTDRIDIYWLHQWDGHTPLEETLGALNDLTRAGKIGYVGVSNFSGWHIMKMLAVAEREGLVRPVGQQIHYTLQAREAEHELLPIAVGEGVGAVIWTPLAGGLLTGKYRRNVPHPEGTRKTGEWDVPPVYDVEKLYDIVETLITIAAVHLATPAQIALAWTLTRPGVASLVIGARTDQQLADNLKAADIRLSPEELAMLEAVSQHHLPYPYWHQRDTGADRLSPADLAALGPHLNLEDPRAASLTMSTP